MKQSAIVTHSLSKRYRIGGPLALDSLSLQVQKGEVYGFLGPNGAGKSTTIRLLMNFIQPTSGGAEILGKDIVSDSVAVKKSVGYLAGEIALYPKMTGRQFLDYMSELQPPKNKKRAGYLAKLFKAELDMKIRDLSKGNRQKIGLIQAFLHEPDVMILDEPTSGLDPLMQEEFFKLVQDAKSAGVSFFISSHNLAEVQKMCDKVGFIREGKLINEQNIAAAISDAARSFDIVFADDAPLAALKRIKRAKVNQISPRHITIHLHGDLAPLFKLLAGYKVNSINQRELNLESEFLQFYEGEKK